MSLQFGIFFYFFHLHDRYMRVGDTARYVLAMVRYTFLAYTDTPEQQDSSTKCEVKFSIAFSHTFAQAFLSITSCPGLAAKNHVYLHLCQDGSD